MRAENEDFDYQLNEGDESPMKGSNFLVSAVLSLRRQKRDLQREVAILKDRVKMLESHNAAFLNINADRLIKF